MLLLLLPSKIILSLCAQGVVGLGGEARAV